MCVFGISKPCSDRLNLGARLGQIGRPDAQRYAQLNEALAELDFGHVKQFSSFPEVYLPVSVCAHNDRPADRLTYS